MWNWNPFTKKSEPQVPVAPAPETKVHTLTPEISLADLAAPSNVLLRKMKWVTDTQGRTGILVNFDSSGNAEVDYTNILNGETIERGKVRVSALRLAKFKEIPEVRRQHLSPMDGATLGYF